MLPNGQAQLLLFPAQGQDYVIQASADLADWVPISVLTASNLGPLPFVDPGSD